jgi:hypothetical protein
VVAEEDIKKGEFVIEYVGEGMVFYILCTYVNFICKYVRIKTIQLYYYFYTKVYSLLTIV